MAEILNIPEYEGAGVYMIKGINNDLIYIGSSKNVKRRLHTHRSCFRNGRFQSKKMKDLIKEYHVFDVEILEKVSPELSVYYLEDMERFYIKKYNSYGHNGLNGSPSGYMHKYKHTLHGIREDLWCLVAAVNEFEKRMDDTSLQGEHRVRLVHSSEKRIYHRLNDMIQKINGVCGEVLN